MLSFVPFVVDCLFNHRTRSYTKGTRLVDRLDRSDTKADATHFVATRGNGRSTIPVPSFIAMI